MSDITETTTVQDGQAAVRTVTVSGQLKPAASATDVITLVKTADGDQAAVKVVSLGGGGGGGDYLPLSGGTLTGPLGIGRATLRQEGNNVLLDFDSAKGVFTFNCGAGHFLPLRNGFGGLGQSNNRWGIVHTQNLNNGADLAVPTEGGTLARTEDIDAAVGDISTALTAILGE